ncbi:MAG: DNA polymerase [Coriobacteriia bacterium]|jgi:DNA polymerase I-like protein with 3'-5' exonuclease and polymerase domains|nr:DNA polymerase [Coriobacteriia bacterium]
MWSYKKAPDKNGKLRIVRGDDGQPVPSQPKFHDKGELCKNLEEINSEFEHVKLVVQWVVLRHRRGFAAGVLENLRPDGTVPATGMALGTPTTRVTHSVVANVPKADPKVFLGKECRQIFRARPGRVFVGVDAAGLELRCLAHYANSPELVQLVLADKDKGELDIHTVLAQGYAEAWPTVTRNSGKNITYGLLYGGSDKKIGQTAGAPDSKAEAVGAACRAVFLSKLPGMDNLMKKIEAAARVGYIKAIDGRRINIRMKHATLNMLLQSCGSILVKWAQCYMNAKIREQRLDAWQVVSYHDEVQLDAHPAHAERAGKLFIEGLQWAGKRFGFRCPLDGEVKVGLTWADTH